MSRPNSPQDTNNDNNHRASDDIQQQQQPPASLLHHHHQVDLSSDGRNDENDSNTNFASNNTSTISSNAASSNGQESGNTNNSSLSHHQDNNVLYPRFPHFGAIVNWNDLQREVSMMIQQQYASSGSTTSSMNNDLAFSSPSSMSHHQHHHSHNQHHHRHHTDNPSFQQPVQHDGLSFVDMTQPQSLPPTTTTDTTNVPLPTTTTAGHQHPQQQQQQPQQLTTEQILLQQQLEELQSASFGERLGFSSNQELVNFLFRAVPLVLFPAFLFLYFHFIGVLTFLWLLLAIFTVHERLKQQVGLKENRSIWMLLLLILICSAHIALLYFFLNKYKPWWFLIFQDASSVKRDFWDSIFFVVITDCVLKLGSMAIKSLTVILIGSLPFKTTIKGRIYANIETLFYSYRCCLPVAVWVRYIWNPDTYHIAFSIFITIIYAGFKLRSILEALWKSFCALRILFSSTAPFGRYATREEVLEADDTCSICQDEFVKPIALDCSHMFCEECITAWFAHENTCPICRAKQENIKLKFTDGSSNLGIFCL